MRPNLILILVSVTYLRELTYKRPRNTMPPLFPIMIKFGISTLRLQSLKASWEMPFDWNLSRIKAVNIFVHEELKVPKSFTEFSNTTVFNATVNGQPVSGRALAIDPFSSDNALIIHYLLTKNDILKLAGMKEVVDDSNNTMKFTLMPISHASKQSSSDITTDFGAIHISLNWSPNPPRPGQRVI